ncbi:MFS transporter [Streptomyces sp. NBC_00582]|uniref:MFS transporter n=1 Tax=Streptomyces sp. NBC_00582 TaxID=2975783 RepID=UPI002E813E38|nr:MFS transporter [Streptomyces sp. NBC_00582]WUB66042.1 MFS transporter [Streptomyces sp. NBC_00582]
MQLLLALGGICELFAVTVTKPVETALRDSLHLSAVEVGWVGAVTLLGSLVSERLTAVFGKGLAPRRPLALAFVAYGAFSAASGLAWNLTSLLVFRTVMGFGSGVVICQVGAMLRERSGFPHRRRLAVSTLLAPPFGILASTLLGSAALSMFSDETAWRAVLLLGGVPLPVGLYAVARLPESPRWLAAHGRYAEADRIVRGVEESVLRKGFDLKDPQTKLQADPAPRVPAVLSKPYVRRVMACVMPVLMVFATYNLYFQ